jgi:hypothetical protein
MVSGMVLRAGDEGRPSSADGDVVMFGGFGELVFPSPFGTPWRSSRGEG